MNLKGYLGIRLEGLRRTTRNISISSALVGIRTLQPQNTISECHRYINPTRSIKRHHHLMNNNELEMTCNKAVVAYFEQLSPKIWLETDLRNHEIHQSRYSTVPAEVRTRVSLHASEGRYCSYVTWLTTFSPNTDMENVASRHRCVQDSAMGYQ
jgi:hypothetical protein